MSLTSENMTPADIAAVTGNHGGGFGFGNGDGAWWIIILFLFAFAGGWNNGGFGGSRGGAADNYVLSSDFAMTERKLDGISNGLCDGFYAQAQLANGTNMALANGFAQAELSRANQQAATMAQLNSMAMAQQNCCCENRQAIAGVNYNLATQTAALQNTICGSTRDIIDSQNAGTRAILDAMNAQAMEQKNERIAELQSQVQQLNLAASQSMQNSYLISQLRPSPIPAFAVPNPYAFNGCGCGCNV